MNSTYIAHDIYLLLTIFSSSKEICCRRSDENDKGSVYGYSIREFELPEIGRLLVSLAASCRNDWDSRSQSIDDTLKNCGQSSSVGTLTKDIAKPSQTNPLLVRESWNKILHCNTMNFQRSEGPSVYSGHLEPQVHLYGEWNAKEWKASIDIYRWCEVMHALT